MSRIAISVFFASILSLSACVNTTQEDRAAAAGTVLGAGTGLLLADAFGANDAWTVAAGIGGAVIGQQVARNSATNQCAYYAGENAQGEPVYRTGAC